jgi:hypothetical protein
VCHYWIYNKEPPVLDYLDLFFFKKSPNQSIQSIHPSIHQSAHRQPRLVGYLFQTVFFFKNNWPTVFVRDLLAINPRLSISNPCKQINRWVSWENWRLLIRGGFQTYGLRPMRVYPSRLFVVFFSWGPRGGGNCGFIFSLKNHLHNRLITFCSGF